MLALIGWVIAGVIIGLIARALFPGRQAMGFLGTMILGIIGSLLGGGITWLLYGANDPYHPAGWIMSVIGAIIVIAIAQARSPRTIP